MSADPLAVAQAEADNVARLAEQHARKCNQDGCPQCVSLAGHVERTRKQVGLLEPGDLADETEQPEQPPLFGT